MTGLGNPGKHLGWHLLGSQVDTSPSKGLVQHHRLYWSGRQRPFPCQAIEDIGEEALVGAGAGEEDPDAASADFDPSADLEELEPDGLAASAGLSATLQAQAPELREQDVGEGGKPQTQLVDLHQMG